MRTALSLSHPGERAWAVAAGVGAAGVATFGMMLADDLGGSRAAVVGGIVLVVLAGAPTAMRLRRHGFDGPGLTALATIVLIGLTSIAWVGTPTDPFGGVDRGDVVVALVLVALGLGAFGVGTWLLGPARAPAPLRLSTEDMPTWPVLVGLASLSLLAVGAGFALESYGYISDPDAARELIEFAQVFALLGALGNLVVLATALVCFQKGGRHLQVLLAALVVMQVAVGLVTGSKTPVIVPLVLVALAYAAIRRRVPMTALVLTAVLLFVAVVPINQRYREAVRVEGQPPAEALRTALAHPVELNPFTAFENTREYVLTRFRSIDSIALIADQTPSRFPYAGGESYFYLPAIILVPRLIWPDKPVLDAAAEFTQTYRGLPEEIRSATQLTQVGDLYRNFGWPGVVGGMFAWGLLVAAGTAWYRRNPSPRVAFVYLFAVPTILLRVEADLPVLIAGAARDLPFAALVAWLLVPGKKSGPGYRRLLGRERAQPRPAGAS